MSQSSKSLDICSDEELSWSTAYFLMRVAWSIGSCANQICATLFNTPVSSSTGISPGKFLAEFEKYFDLPSNRDDRRDITTAIKLLNSVSDISGAGREKLAFAVEWLESYHYQKYGTQYSSNDAVYEKV